MAQTLNEYLKTHSPRGFRPVPHYFPLGDFVTYYFRNDRCYEERVDDLLTVYRAFDSHELVGCKITGVKHILQTAGEFSLALDDQPKKLAFFFFIGAATAKDTAKKHYAEMAPFVKDAELQLT